MHEAHGFVGDISEEESEQEISRLQDIPVSSPGQKNYAPQSSMGDRYNVHKASAGVCVPSGGTGLVESLCVVVAHKQYAGCFFL